MDPRTRRSLEAINRRFYAERAQDFDSSRSRPWQGWGRALEGLPADATLHVLDLGCGNGRLLAHLRERFAIARFVGTDSCAPLIEVARERYASAQARFEHAELFDERGGPLLADGAFEVVALMGVLHHVPSLQARRALVHAAFERTAPGGRLVLTVWRFERDSRLSKRTVAWQEAVASDPELAALDLAQLEPGDTLLQWNKGARAVRYCHAIADGEIEAWLADLPAQVERFYADGDGELNEYVVLRRL
jgi:2-polyprenyl-3-methyl-5-hydroxy-6-metoxy-1,4-benzoquinol methylase